MKFSVQLTYRISGKDQQPLNEELLRALWGKGLERIHRSGSKLVFEARVKATATHEAVELTDVRLRTMWHHVSADVIQLAAASATSDLVKVGGGGRHRKRWSTRTEAWSVGLQEPGDPGNDWPGDWSGRGPDDGPDWGGDGAGVREPRRPLLPTGYLSAELPVPPTVLD